METLSLALYGKDFEKEGQRHLQFLNPRIATAISAGFKVSFVSKTHPNEDCLSVATNGDMTFMAVADAHWGREASHIAIDICHKNFQSWLEKNDYAFEKIPPLFGSIQENIFDHFKNKVTSSVSETSLTIAVLHHRKQKLEFAEYGDCFLYLITEKKTEILSIPDSNWLGAHSHLATQAFLNGKWIGFSRQPLQYGLRQKSLDLPKEGCLLLATDGLIQPIYGVDVLTSSYIADFAKNHKSFHSLAEGFLDEALRRDRVYERTRERGGEDNVAFILVKI